MPRSPFARPLRLTTALAAACCLGAGLVHADDPPPASGFKPEAISIGDPLPLQIGPARTEPGADAEPSAAATPSKAVPGSGWIGLAVAESNVPGRWQIAEIAEAGPAARAGIRIGDELRAVNGIEFKSFEEVTQSLTTIAAGQDVRVAIARGDQVSDVVLLAETRPAQPARPDWQAAEQRAGSAAPSAAAPSAAAASAAPLPAAPAAALSAAPAPVAPAVPSVVVPPPAADQLPPPQPSERRGRTALGVRTLPIDPALQARFRLSEPSGAYVIGVVQDLPASRGGVPPGSVIVALDERPVRSPVELTRLVTTGPVDRPVSVQYVLPGGEAKQAQVVLQPLEAPLAQALVEEGPVVAQPLTAGVPPALEPGPVARRVERPLSTEARAVRAEMRLLRLQLERLERRLEAIGRQD